MAERVPDEEAGAADEEGIGDVERRPGPGADHHQNPVADGVDRFALGGMPGRPGETVEPEAVVEVSQDARRDAAEGHQEQAVVGGAPVEEPGKDAGGGRHGEGGEKGHPALPDAEERTFVEARLKAHDPFPQPPDGAAGEAQLGEDPTLRSQIRRAA